MADLITRVYSNFRGVDFRGDEINLLRSPDALNVWKDYKETESIRTRPGIEKSDICALDNINGVFFYKERVFVHSGGMLFEIIDGVAEPIDYVRTENVGDETAYKDAISNAFIYNDIWYFKDGRNYLRCDGETIECLGNDNNNCYIPTTTIARKPMGGGTKCEDGNILSDFRKNSFVADGVSFTYFLDTRNIDDDFYPEVTISNRTLYYRVKYHFSSDSDETYYLIDEAWRDLPSDVIAKKGEAKETTKTGEPIYEVTVDGITYEFCVLSGDDTVSPYDYTVNYKEGSITFTNVPPEAPLTDGQDNVVIKFKKTVKDKDGNPAYHGLIEKCTMLQVFDNRVFFSGNPEYPNMVWHCSLNDPTYVSDLDYYEEGMDGAAVKGLVAGNNALWVFREPSDANTTVFYHTPALDDEYGKIYPSSHSSITTGCVGKAINFNDDIVFFSERGMEGISGDITTEQFVAHRSSLVDRKMTAEPDYKNMVLAEWEGYLFVFIGKKAYLADSRARFTNEDHLEYEWFMWEIEKEVKCATVHNGILYLGTTDGLYTLTDMNANIESYWVTPLDKFKNPNKLKTTNKRGCVAEATGDISVYAKLEDTDFELIGEYNDVKDYFVSRIKRKKFKDIQLKFESKTRFSLETVTLEAFIGGYIKR